MKRSLSVFPFLVLGILAFQSPGLAEQVNGVVVSVAPEAKSMTIVDRAASKDNYQLYNVSIQDDTKFEGVDSLENIKAGDEVQFEAAEIQEEFTRDVLHLSSINNTEQINVTPQQEGGEQEGGDEPPQS